MSMEQQSVKQCCATFYGSDLARMLLGDSFHPGGTTLTTQLGELLTLTPESHVLDVASGRGTSAFHITETFGCRWRRRCGPTAESGRSWHCPCRGGWGCRGRRWPGAGSPERRRVPGWHRTGHVE